MALEPTFTLSPAPSAASPVPREVELKLFVPPSSVARLWSHPLIERCAIAPLRIARLESRYFDTPERDLAVRRMALRLRRSGRRWLQTLKVAPPDDRALSTRGEWEMPVLGPRLALELLDETPFAGLVGDARSRRALAGRLTPLFTTNFRRESRMLRLSDGSEVEFAFDVGLIVAGRGAARRSLPICEVEIELERDGGDGAAALLRFAARLARDLPLIPLAASKAARGYRLADRVPLEPVKVDLPVAAVDESARAHLSRVLEAGNAALLGNTHALFEMAARGDVAASIEFVHQARVAVRRLRSALRTFRPVARGRRFERLDGQLRAIGRMFGQARDWDVLTTATVDRIEREVATDIEGRAASSVLRLEAGSRREQAHRELMGFLDVGAFGATTIAIERLATRLREEPPGGSAATIGALAPGWLAKQRARVVARSRRIAVLDPEERHGLRIEVKRLRYALDLLEGLYDERSVAVFRDALADLQDRLGKLNDATVALALLVSLSPDPGSALLGARFAEWLDRHVRKQLPKVAAESVALELTQRPWRMPPAIAASPAPSGAR